MIIRRINTMMRRISWIALALSLIGPANDAMRAAQQANVLDPQRAWAFVVGISNYEHAEPLKYAASDASSIADFLKSPRGGGFLSDHIDVLLEGDATRTNVLSKLSGPRGLNKRVREGDTVYIFLAGHGYTEAGLGYFVPSDASLDDIAAGGVFLEHIKALIERGLSAAKVRIFVADLCNSGRAGTELSPLTVKIQNLINEELTNIKVTGGSFVNLLASRPNEYSYERDDIGKGVFTHFLLEALNGKASTRPGLADAAAVVKFVKGAVPEYTADKQHPISNENIDPALALAFLDRPGPAATVTVQASLVIRNVDRVPYERVEWTDKRYGSHASRRLARESGTVQIGALPVGEVDLQFADSANRSRVIKVTLKEGENTLDLLSAAGAFRFQAAGPAQVASAGAVPWAPPLQGPPMLAESTLLIRVTGGTTAQLDGSTFRVDAVESELLQMSGLAPGIHTLSLATNANREYRFRLRLFPGTQSFDISSGEMLAVREPQRDPALVQIPAGVPANLVNAYRNFEQAIWADRIIAPAGASAWDYFIQLRDAVPAALRDLLSERIAVAMGNRAQRTVLRYLRGGEDVRWTSAVFEEGATLTQRTQQFFQPLIELQSQELFFNARALIEQGRNAEAIPLLQRAVQLFPQASHAFNAIGLAYWKQGQLAQAVPALQQAIALSPRWTYPRNLLALIMLEQRRYPEAEQALTDTLTLNPEDSASHHALAQLYLLTGQAATAEARLRQAVEFNPGNAYAYGTYGLLEQRLGRLDSAETMLRLAMRLEPDEPSFQVNLAELLRLRGRQPEGRQILARLADTYPSDLRVVRAYTTSLAEQSRTGDVRLVFEKAVRLAPKSADLLVLYADFLNRQRLAGDAEKQYKAAIAASASNVFAHHGLAGLYLSQGKIQQAERELETAMKADPRFPSSPMLLGQIRFGQRRFTEAAAAYSLALSLAVEPDQKQKLAQFFNDAARAAGAEAIQAAKREMERNRMKAAWTIYAAGLKAAPSDAALIAAALSFERDRPADADIKALPPSPLAAALSTSFWNRQREAEALWKAGRWEEALDVFLGSVSGMSPAERRPLTAVAFNAPNDANGIHEMIYRWGNRAFERKRFDLVLKLIESALAGKIFDYVPGLRPPTIDSLMTPEENPDPKQFEDFEVQHHPDRRAHELLAVAYAGLGDTAKSEDFLKALSPADQTEVRRAIERALRR